MQDPRLEFLESIVLERMKVELSGSPIVLLCGGLVPIKEGADDDDPPIVSLRQAISLGYPSFEFVRPEEITDWQIDGTYENLMDFERDLAGVCSLVVIVLESPGAIAELGAFSQLEDLRHRLLVFISSDFHNDDSFIRLGILRHIESAKEGSVRAYSWGAPSERGGSLEVASDILNDMLKDIQDQIDSLSKREAFKKDNNSHAMALICQLLSVFIALKIGELSEYLSTLGVVLTEAQLKRKLFILERFKIIKKGKYSDSTYYAPTEVSFHSVTLSHRGGKPVDSLRVTASCSDFYKTTKDRHRVGFLKEMAAGDGGG